MIRMKASAARVVLGLAISCGISFTRLWAQGPSVILSPSSLTFSVQAVGTTSTSQPVTLSNSGPGSLSVSAVVLTGSFSGDFAQTNNCEPSVSSGASCTVNVTFVPAGTGTRTATLLLMDNAGNSPQAVKLTGTGEGACANISDCAYDVLNQRATANQTSFFVYKDADSAFNHGFASGLFGSKDIDLKAVIIDSACVDDPASSTGCSTDSTRLDGTRGTALRVSFPPLPLLDDFVGLNFQDPENYAINSLVGTGYNLSPADTVQFDVRSPAGAVVQFGVGGCVTQFSTIGPGWTPITIPIDTLFPPPGDSTAQCPPDLTDTHILFTVGASGTRSPGGGTVLLDNIQFTPVPARQSTDLKALSLPLSNHTFGVIPRQANPISPDQANRNLAAIYESALTILSLLKRGQPADVAGALEIANALDYALHHDNHGDSLPVGIDGFVGLHSGYASGDIALLNDQPRQGAGKAGDARLAVFFGGTTLCGSTGYCLVLDGGTGGNNAWAILALAAAYLQSGNPTYLTDAETIGNWIVGTLSDQNAVSYGGYFVGFTDGGQQLPILGKSTENNADIFAAFSLLAQIESDRGNSTGATYWTTNANVAGDFVMQMFDSAYGRFYAGTVTAADASHPGDGISPDFSLIKGNDVVNTFDFIDSDTFITLAMGGAARYQTFNNNPMDWSFPMHYIFNLPPSTSFLQSVMAGGITFQGFNITPAAPGTGVAWEFTGQAAETCNYVDSLKNATTFQNCAQTYVAQILQAQKSAPFGDGAGLVASVLQNGDLLPLFDQCLPTPFQCIPERPGLAATNWGIIAEQAFNPLAFAAVSLVPSPLIFPDQLVGGNGSQQVTLTSTGTAPLTIGSIGIFGSNSNDFSQTNTCPVGSPLLGAASCTITVRFTPSASGARSATLSVGDNGLGSPQRASLTGNGQPIDDFAIGVSPASQSVVAGNFTSYTVTTSITRGSAQSVTLSLTGLPACAIATFNLPTITSGQSSILTITTGINCAVQNYPLTIIGTGAEVTRTAPASLTIQPPDSLSTLNVIFSPQLIGTSSAAQSVILTNPSSLPLNLASIVLTGSFSGDFLQTNNCGASLSSGASCSITVTFTPTGAGTRTATLVVLDNAGNSPLLVTLTGTGQGSCSNTSDCAYTVLNQRVTDNQNAFFVYKDADSGFNHGFPSGLFTNYPPYYKQVIIDAGCVDDPTSVSGCSSGTTHLDATRGTVFRIKFPPLIDGRFVGLNFQDPEDYVPILRVGNGYNLTPATSVQFDVRSPDGAITQFGVGGCVTPFFPLSSNWSTLTIPFNSLIMPGGGTSPCTFDITAVHLLFAVDVAAPNSGTILLDNIQFTRVPTRQTTALSLPVSTQSVGVAAQQDFPIPVDQAVRNLSTLYESSLTILSLIKRGQSADVSNAMEIANALDYALHHDNQGDLVPPAPDGSVALHSGYSSGDLVLLNDQKPPYKMGIAGEVSLAGFSASSDLCGPTKFCLVLDGATGGNNAWAIMAFAAAYLQSGNATYLADAESIGNWIVSKLADSNSPSYGGYIVGFADGGSPKAPLLGKSTEYNADIFAAFSVLAQIEAGKGNGTASAYWSNNANVAGDFVAQMFDPVFGRFYAGTVDSVFLGNPIPGICPSQDPSQQRGNDIINTCDFLSSNSLATMAMAGVQRYQTIHNKPMDWTRPLLYVLHLAPPNSFSQSVTADSLNPQTFQGFSLLPAAPATGVIWESTAQAVETCSYLDSVQSATTFQKCAQTYAAQILQAQNWAPFGDGMGVVASTVQSGDTIPPANQCVITPYACIPERVGLAATNWAIFASQNFNPFALLGATFTPPNLTFGAQLIGTTSGAETATFTNIGIASITVGTSNISGINAGDFTKIGDLCAGSTIPPAGTCTVSATFTPTGIGQRAATLTITDSATNSPQAVNLTGTGLGPIVSLSPSSLSFGNQALHEISAPQYVTLTNTGTAALAITSVASGSTEFTATNLTCPISPNTLAPIASCTLSARFTPRTSGARSGGILITDNALNSSQSVGLSGNGVISRVSLSTTSIVFKTQLVGTVSTSSIVTLTNGGAAALTINSINLGGDFNRGPTTTCPLSGTLASGAKCTIAVRFAPTVIGTRYGQITIAHSDVSSPQVVGLSGTGIAVKLSATKFIFATQLIGTQSAAKTLTLSNTNSVALDITGISSTGDFMQTNNCGNSVPASGNCVISIRLQPTAAGPRTGTLTITDNDPTSPQTVSLSGTGTAVKLSATSLAFGSETVGTTSAPKTTTITNAGTTAVTISGISITMGADPGDFAIQPSSTCVAGGQLNGGARCAIDVTFTPSALGARSAKLTLTDTDPTSPQNVSLSGTGK